MRNWELVDYRELHEEEQDYPRVVILSANQLREQLNQLRQSPPGVYELYAPDGETLEVAIGGRFAGLSWAKPPAARNSLSAMPRTICADAPVVFTNQGLENTYDPEDLFPVEEVIDAIVYFYQTHRIPEWLDWRYWNGDTKQWETKRGTGTAPAAAGLAGSQPTMALGCPDCAAGVAPREGETRQEVCPRCGEPVVR
jgi:hypothetical protein